MNFDDNIGYCFGIHKQKYANEDCVGIELEFENYRKNRQSRLPASWKSTGDASLRNDGVEFVSRITPLDKYDASLRALGGYLSGARVNPTSRCGVHVHTNVRKYTWKQLWSIVTYYLYIEPWLFQRWAPERRDNHFCVPLAESTRTLRFMANDGEKLLKGKSVKKLVEENERKLKKATCVLEDGYYRSTLSRMRYHYPDHLAPMGLDVTMEEEDFPAAIIEYEIAQGYGKVNPADYSRGAISLPQSSKYHALNFSRLAGLGSIEWRHLGATANTDHIKSWVDFVVKVVLAAVQYKDSGDIVKEYNEGGLTSLMRNIGIYYFKEPAEEQQEEAEDAAAMITSFIKTDVRRQEPDVMIIDDGINFEDLEQRVYQRIGNNIVEPRPLLRRAQQRTRQANVWRRW